MYNLDKHQTVYTTPTEGMNAYMHKYTYRYTRIYLYLWFFDDW
jgi:hypothetical protein